MSDNFKKNLIVFNPVAGFKYPKGYKEYFLRYYKKFLPQTGYDWLETTPQLKAQLKQVDFSQYQKIIGIGGDGTIKNIADYLLSSNTNLPLAIVPQGSCNALASSLQIPLIPSSAIKCACLGKEKKIDVGWLNQQEYFLICLSIGHWSKIIQATARGLKIKVGFLAYVFTFLKQWKIYRATFNFKLDGQAYKIEGNTMVIANALSVFKLRPRTPVDFSDGQLEILITRNKTIAGFVRVVLAFFFGKRRFPFLFKNKGKKISLEYFSEMEKLVQIDGEAIKVDKIEVEILPKKLTIIARE
ncbi:TPA: hypothetical protein DCL28_02690 [Candidatus Komeilibacteria bacterium]|nr:MAG: hypothetical protein A3J95_01615 [Candidatus Komeilibacteria bacterium RIFOXYC2_FULL_45_12]OGY94221.1 MAG: hypothetical protein A2260_02700 [Candidatus Komeilibacteria bacterium RIFOXYA2_FULL_45_9]HAH04442.1 hypothetical protein [Candidatus Komeilibacteria bacterium]HCC73422.1 hypothetical protein [Candidatus Komeilibacteria bacterium]